MVGRSSPPPAATSSSTKNGLPSARALTRSNIAGDGSAPMSLADQLAGLGIVERTELQIDRPAGPHELAEGDCEAARPSRPGGRRVATTTTGAARTAVAT